MTSKTSNYLRSSRSSCLVARGVLRSTSSLYIACFFFFVLLLALASTTTPVESKCLGPPFLYVTFHGGSGKSDINNVMRFSRDGCNMGNVLHSSDAKDLDELRGISLIPAPAGGDHLLVANANADDSRVVLYGACNPNDNQYRPFLSNLVLSSSSNPGLSHPYAIRIHPPVQNYQSLGNSSLYVSNQDSGLITYYNLQTGDPGPVSSFLAASGEFPPGSFAKIDSVSGASFRGFAFDSNGDGSLWAADDVSYAMQYNSTTGEPMSKVSLLSPIGVDFFVVEGKELMFISANAASTSNDMVYAYDPDTLEVVHIYGPEKLDHPAGFIAYEDVLFVLSQNSQSIVTFNLTSGEYLDVIVDDLPDQPEQVILAYC